MEAINLTRGQGAGIDNISGVLLNLLALLRQGRAGQGHETSASGLKDTEGTNELEERVDTARLSRPISYQISKVLWKAFGRHVHFNNAVVGADIQNLAAELVGQAGDSIQVLVLVAQTLAERQVAGVVLHSSLVAVALLLITGGGDLTVVLQELLKELGTKNRDLGEK